LSVFVATETEYGEIGGLVISRIFVDVMDLD